MATRITALHATVHRGLSNEARRLFCTVELYCGTDTRKNVVTIGVMGARTLCSSIVMY
jgi:hypothetical protein